MLPARLVGSGALYLDFGLPHRRASRAYDSVFKDRAGNRFPRNGRRTLDSSPRFVNYSFSVAPKNTRALASDAFRRGSKRVQPANRMVKVLDRENPAKRSDVTEGPSLTTAGYPQLSMGVNRRAKPPNPRAERSRGRVLEPWFSTGFPARFRDPQLPWGGGNYKTATCPSKLFFMHSAWLQNARGISQAFHRHTSDRRLHERGSARRRKGAVHESHALFFAGA